MMNVNDIFTICFKRRILKKKKRIYQIEIDFWHNKVLPVEEHCWHKNLYNALQQNMSVEKLIDFYNNLHVKVLQCKESRELIAICIYPKLIVDNYDPLDVLFRRADVIARVMLFARSSKMMVQ